MKVITGSSRTELSEVVTSLLAARSWAAMLAEAGLDPKDVPPEYGGTLQGFDYGWHLKG